jgi:ABC-type uncharacterized transport system auxiliary subunit
MNPPLLKPAAGTVAVAAAVLLAGCALTTNPYHPVTMYDVRIPLPAARPGDPINLAVQIEPFAALDAAGTRMVYRKAEHRVAHDEYNRWVQPPADLVAAEFYRGFAASRAFREVLAPADTGGEFCLSGTVSRLEVDVALNAAVRLDVRIRDARSQRLVMNRAYDETEPLTAATPDAFADAAARALARIVQQVLEDTIKAAAHVQHAATES